MFPAGYFSTPVSTYFTSGCTYFAGVDPEQDMHSKIRKRKVTKAARPTQKAMTMESVDTVQGLCHCYHGKNETWQDDLSPLIKVCHLIHSVPPLTERNLSANLLKVLGAS